ncbi:HPr family phosphocarrier protein [Paenibacillus frigoriresistens]|uniref:HPr family phosphocarrier protein n=1 Tax=Paenibacillus alginolyticus TaxID=59839 RepID=UPI001562F6E0|nr:HPr family phosphocarrier protein [Paenibacillus frigoriresistens]NRF95845.1 HPr family phosphocarrier protein [Paenibacillus frigoriresistens]
MQKEFTIANPLGIHSRPAGDLMKKAKTFPCEVSLIKNDKRVNGKSIVGVLALEMRCGDKVTLVTNGEREQEAMNEIGFMLESILE